MKWVQLDHRILFYCWTKCSHANIFPLKILGMNINHRCYTRGKINHEYMTLLKKKKKTRRKMKTHSFISYLGWCSTGFICTTKPSAAFLCGGGYTSKRKANWTTAACLATKSRIENQSCCCWESWRHGSFYRRKKRKQRDWSRSPFPSQSLGHCPASQDPPGTGPVSTNEDYFRCKSGWRRRYFWSPLLLHFWSPLRLPNCY